MNQPTILNKHSPKSMSLVARDLYSGGSAFGYVLQTLRPFICPFHILIDRVPSGARVLDIGCGAGLFLGLLANQNKIVFGLGIDSSVRALNDADLMRSKLGWLNSLEFQYHDITSELPEGQYDVISLIDVMHHIPREQQHQLIKKISQRLAPGGVFLYKDMVKKPFWRAGANRLHDLVLARQWIQYIEITEIEAWLVELGFECTESGQVSMLWYGHEWAVFKRKLA